MAIKERDTVIRVKDENGDEYIEYPATRADNVIDGLTFTENSARSNISNGETLPTLFGKIAKWFTDLKTVAFTGKYSDLTGAPTNATTSAAGLMSAADKTKLNGIASGANKTVVDTALSSTSTNPVQNKVVNQSLKERQRCTTIVVAASGSKNKNAADYVCTGTADQSVINAAIAALPSTGGKIVLLEGTYNTTNKIDVTKSNVTIEGMGFGTVVKNTGSDAAIALRNVSYCQISGINIQASPGHGIYIYHSNFCDINNCCLANTASHGIYTDESHNNMIRNNVFKSCKMFIELAWGSTQNRIIDNHMSSSTERGIYVSNTGDPQLYNYIAGNFIVSPGWCGIDVAKSENKVINNTIIDAGSGGIKVSASAFGCYIVGNSIWRTGNTYGSDQYSIKLDSGTNWNVVYYNHIISKAVTNDDTRNVVGSNWA